MIIELETLIALNKHKTMVKTATYLRITQSAVSKRIAILEKHFKRKLIHRNKNKIVFTEYGLWLVAKSVPLVSDLNEVLRGPNINEEAAKIVLGVSESILVGWFGKFLGYFKKKHREIEIEIHTHRSPVVTNHVNSGNYDVGIISGSFESNYSLMVEKLGNEPFVVVSKNIDFSTCRILEVYTIEKHSYSYKTIGLDLKKNKKLKIIGYLESFTVLGVLARDGVLNGLIPLSVAKGLKINNNYIFSDLKLNRQISLICRKYNLQSIPIKLLMEELKYYILNKSEIFA